jgi:TonB family protein
MLALILSLLVASAPDAPPDKTVSPVVVSPRPSAPVDATVVIKSDDTVSKALRLAWPSEIYEATRDGHVVLTCRVDVHGLAEWCEVASENPVGREYGKVALQMRPTFRLTPAMGPDGPVEARMNIAVEFKAPVPKDDWISWAPNQVPVISTGVTMLNDPVWLRAPGFDDWAKAYPANGGGVEGYALIHCLAPRDGVLTDCAILTESPERRGFGRAALALTRKFRLAPQSVQVRGRHPLWVDIPIRLPPPAAARDRTVDAPIWLNGFNAKAALKVFPPDAADQGLTTGRGVARCAVAPDGSMRNCAPDADVPDGLGFSEAAVKLASTLKANLWSLDGGPVAGGQVRVGIRLNLKSAD